VPVPTAFVSDGRFGGAASAGPVAALQRWGCQPAVPGSRCLRVLEL